MTSTYDYQNSATKFTLLVEKLLALIRRNSNETKAINNSIFDINELDHRCVNSFNNNTVEALIIELCGIVSPSETTLIRNYCKFIINLSLNNIELQNETIIRLKEWILETLRLSPAIVHCEILLALKTILINGQISDIDNFLKLLLGEEKLFKQYLNPSNTQWNEAHYHVIGCLEAILINRNLTRECILIIKDTVLNVVSSSIYVNEDKLYRSKILISCLHILETISFHKLIPYSIDFLGEALGVIQACLFYALKDYPSIKPLLLRPAAMNLPEQIHTVPKCKNLKDHKAKSKKQPSKKTTETKNNISIIFSDSDCSDSESTNLVYTDSKVRLEAIRLLQTLVENSQSRDMFGFWPQIVATGSQSDARVLTRSILKEPVSKVKQHMLSTLTDLLIDAKSFLMHAEESQHTSFITFFGTVSLMIKELHFTLALTLNGDKNVAVLTHALKCASALIQGTPYARLKSGLATKLMRNCRLYIFHKDPTVRVAALSAFEAIASSDPVTPEIYGILAKQSNVDTEMEYLNASFSDNTEEEEVDVEDLENIVLEEFDKKLMKERNICFLLHVCLENIMNKKIVTPVRLQSLKLLGRLAFSTSSLIFPYTDLIATTLSSVIQNSETQIILHACRVLEIMAGCLTNSTSEDSNALVFWNIIFERIIALLQHPQTILREAACDCLGSIGENVFAQLSRHQTVLIITVLFGTVHDEESAVRAAGLRALGMLVMLPVLKEETGFLMDLADIICATADDSNLGVRIKGAWALANLCDCLSKEKDLEEVESIPMESLLPKLYRVSVRGSKDNDKVKCNAVRALGSILQICRERSLLGDTSLGLEALTNCAMLGNDMKVRWNACRALGLVLSNNPDNILQPTWRDQVFPVLCSLICDSANFKVRTNAAWALYSCNSYGKYAVMLWKSIILAFENSQHVPSYIEYPHRDALVQQLCLTLSHVAASTEVSELQNLWAEIGEHVEDVSNYMKQFQETIIPEKIGDLIKAKSQLEKYVKHAPSLEDRRIAQTLVSIFERTNRFDNLDNTIPT